MAASLQALDPPGATSSACWVLLTDENAEPEPNDPMAWFPVATVPVVHEHEVTFVVFCGLES
jgi:hypothetical protein